MIEQLRSLLPGAGLEPGDSRDQPTIVVPAAHLIDVCRTLRDHPELQFTLLADVSAVDWWPREPRYEVVYQLVMPEDADAEKGLISTSSPIGKAILNKEEGDEVVVTAPNGSRKFEVVKLVTIHSDAE